MDYSHSEFEAEHQPRSQGFFKNGDPGNEVSWTLGRFLKANVFGVMVLRMPICSKVFDVFHSRAVTVQCVLPSTLPSPKWVVILFTMVRQIAPFSRNTQVSGITNITSLRPMDCLNDWLTIMSYSYDAFELLYHRLEEQEDLMFCSEKQS